ncbi:2-oxoglutarate dehydrogenase E1 component [Paraliomyxa miuraensis]|uniref:2-oxoglutarate dehydrogenase E1 component n=1 Tax=Paraliomyxa miuraensis TaxID=376150 RepID=UPI0022540307|nr:2-oxoglutarate dehydrogenase E1 component [Paraliomyxa miuraensis]MCX4243797.1 2-oxoglutarate dehydrogenase E1 component [Paraliomyxa miuraensis]
MDRDLALSSYNLPFLESLYEQFLADPLSVEPKWRDLLRQLEATGPSPSSATLAASARAASDAAQAEQIDLQNRVDKLIANYRLLGDYAADIDPLGRARPTQPALELSFYGLDERHLQRRFSAGDLFPGAGPVPLEEILGRLRRTYCRKIGVEYWGINSVEQRRWLRERMEAVENEVRPSVEEQTRLLHSLVRVDNVDKFLHTKFIGAKRFSIAGAESVIALLETLVEEAGELGVESVIMGMAHRGRLNVMMNVMGQTPAQIFSRFAGGDPLENLGRGDVKYHLGSHRTHTTHRGKQMYLALGFNPSHLEAITPVMSGRVRAGQDLMGDHERSRMLLVSIHGDAAVMGQGVYAETLNLASLKGYGIGGTIRVVINNQVGFTTNPIDSRSTVYCTAVADMLHVPVFHVNGDDPEAAAHVAKLAVAFRQAFHTDVIIDLVCYRRFGHNEGDEPTFTQPSMYQQIKRQSSVRELYEQVLLDRGTVTRAQVEQMDDESRAEFEAALDEVRRSGFSTAPPPMHGVWERYRGGPDAEVPEVETKVSQQTLEAITAHITTVPEGFSLHPKLGRFLDELRQMGQGEAPVSWAFAEHMAYGSLVLEGASVRLSGQDAMRGTFTHRHVGWIDHEDEQRYLPLATLPGAKGGFEVLNSPLSEFAVLGFEFGYSLAAPECLVIWEAQFGDFCNGAQVIIDQFISSSEDKWNRISGLTMFLPHGYEGQGPEHSSARLERFLQLCAEDNMQVCNFSTPAQMFHALRRQIVRKWRKPLVIMTPKSLLRTRASFSPLSELYEGSFRRMIDDDAVDPKKVRRVMLCTGKVYYDLVEARQTRERDDVAIVRVEQLYPFPADGLARALVRYEGAKELYWVQEEPRNMGAWTFVRSRLEALLGASGAGDRWQPPRFVGREASASPATGSAASHKFEQDRIMDEAFDGLP